jgi:hypothetical protein
MFLLGTFTEFDDSVSIHDPVIAAAAKIIEMPENRGVVYQMMNAPTIGISQKSFDIYGRTKNSRNGVVGDGAATGWTDAATTDLPMTAAALAGLTIGCTLKVESEVVVVKDIDRSANTIDVFARGMGGTTAAAHADEATFTVIGYSGTDSMLKNVTGVSETSFKYRNYIQTIFEVLDWEKGAELERQGLDKINIIQVLVKEALVRVAEMLSVMAIYGVKQVGDSNGTPYMSAGLLTQLKDTTCEDSKTREVLTYNANGLLTETKLRAALKEVFQVGNPSIILVSSNNKEIINSFNAAHAAIQIATQRTDHTAGMHIDYYDYEGKRLEVKIDADLPDSDIPIVTPAQLKKGWLKDDALKQTVEPTQSTREKREAIQGSVGFQVEGVGRDHTIITGITGGSTERVSKVLVVNDALDPVITDELS